MMKVLGLVLWGLLMPMQVSGTGLCRVPRESYERGNSDSYCTEDPPPAYELGRYLSLSLERERQQNDLPCKEHGSLVPCETKTSPEHVMAKPYKAACDVMSAACEESVTGLFKHEMETLKFPGSTITLIAINGLHVAKAIVLPVKSKYVPGVGVKVGFSAQLKILGTCWSILLSGLTTINVHVDCSALVLLPQYLPLTTSVAVKDCQCAVVLQDISINLLNIHASVTASLANNILLALQVKEALCFCQPIQKLYMCRDLLLALLPFTVLPFEKGKLRYVAQTPKVNDQFIDIPVQIEYLADNGKKIPIPPLSGDFVILPQLNHTSEAIGENVVTSILSYTVFKKPHSFSCTPQTFLDTLSLELILSDLIVSKCPACTPISSSLFIVTKVVTPLTVGLDVNLCAMNLTLSLQIMDKKGHKKPVFLIALKAKLGLTATLQLVEGKVQFTASLDRLHFKLVSSIVGPVIIVHLQAPLRAFILKIILKQINFYLHLAKIPIFRAPGLKPNFAHCHPSKHCLVCHKKTP